MAPFARAKQEISTDQMFRSTTVLKCSSTTTSWVRVRENKTQLGRKKESRHNDDHELIIIHTTVPLSLFFTSLFILRRPQFSLLHSGDALHGPFGNGKTEREGPMIITSSKRETSQCNSPCAECLTITRRPSRDRGICLLDLLTIVFFCGKSFNHYCRGAYVVSIIFYLILVRRPFGGLLGFISHGSMPASLC
jgi:hypothetical protein